MDNRNLLKEIQAVRDKIKNHPQEYYTNEKQLRTQLIDPILIAIGWDVRDPKRVKNEYPAFYGHVDYLLIKERMSKQKTKEIPVLIIETKNLNESIGKPKDVAQVLKYCDDLSVKYALITNGLYWKLFKPFKEKKGGKRELWEMNIETEDKDLLLLKFRMLSYTKITNIENGLEILQKVIHSKENQKRREYAKEQMRQEILESSWQNLIKNRNGIVENLARLFDEYLSKNPKFKREKFSNSQKAQFLKEKIAGLLISISPMTGSRKTKIGSPQIQNNIALKKSMMQLRFNGKTYPVRTNREALLKILEIMKQKHPKDFSTIFTLHGTKRQYFSTKKADLVDPIQIPGTNVYCMANLSAKSIKRLIRNTLDIFNEGNFELS